MEEEENASRFGTLTRRDRDRIIQTQVDILLQREHLLVNEDTLQYHIEYILLIKLVRMLSQGTLTFERYQRMKRRHREDIRMKLRRKEILSYDYDRDVYGRLDAAMEDELRKMAQEQRIKPPVPLTFIAEEPVLSASPRQQRRRAPPTAENVEGDEISFVVHLDQQPTTRLPTTTTTRLPKSSPEQDEVVQKHVRFLLDEAQPPVKPRKLQYHIEHVIMIRLGHMLNEGHLDFKEYSAEKDKLRAEMIADFENYDTCADIYSRLDQDLMTTAKKPRKKGEPEPDKDAIIQKLVAELLKEAKVSTDKKDLRYHEEHILLIRLGNLMTSGRLTYTKYVDMKNKHHNKMRQKLLDNEIEYYSFDTDIFGKLDKLILVEVEVIIAKEKDEAEKLQAEREAKWAAEKAQQEQDRKEALERAKKRREEKEAQAAKEAAKLAQKQKEEEEAAEKARQERLLKEEAQRAQREAEEAERLEQEKKEKEELAAAWRADREKVRDEFGDRRSIKPGEEDKIIIKPANLNKSGEGGEEEEDLGDQERKDPEKCKDYFPEQRSIQKKEEEKIVIKPNLRAAAKFGGAKATGSDDKDKVTVTTQFVETTQPEVRTADLGTTSDDDKRVQWNLQVNQSGEDEEQRTEEPQEVKERTIQKLEFERQTTDDPSDEAWTLKIIGDDKEMITSAITHNTSIVTNITASMQENSDRYINLVWSTENTPVTSPTMSRKNEQ